MLSGLSRHIGISSFRRAAVPTLGAIRHLNVHEHSSMELMNKYSITTPEAYVATTPEEAELHYTKSLQEANQPSKEAVIKAQVLSGGRGLGHFKNGFEGGVHMVTKPGLAREFAEKMLGEELVTKQCPNGVVCNKVFLMERIYPKREMYLSILMDRRSGGPLIVASPRGGTSIEDVAKTNPEAIFSDPIDIVLGLTQDQCKQMARNLGMQEGTPVFENTVKLMMNLYEMFISCDCTQVEVNPLTETIDGEVVVCDAKVNFDDRAENRQKEIFAWRDYSQEDPREVEAGKYGLKYISLDGSIGCMVNGAGLAMATMDLIKLKGKSPANFLDVGGGNTEEAVKKAFEILNEDEKVKVILVNIFGGIMRCDMISNGIIHAVENVGVNKPVVIRLQGTNVEKARTMIKSSGFRFILAHDMGEAASKAVAVADIAEATETLSLDALLNQVEERLEASASKTQKQ